MSAGRVPTYNVSVPSQDGHDDATLLMIAAAEGDQAAADRLLPLVYKQLRAAAQLQMANERADHTLQPTALVHEAFLKLVGRRDIPWQNRRHFYVAAAEAMRRFLVDHARSRGRVKRGGDRGQRQLDFRSVAELANLGESDEIVALDEALRRLESARTAADRRGRAVCGSTQD